jgi:DNA-binding NarL/FixJ family response regulator
MYKILFIDEQKEYHDDFLDYVDYYPNADIVADVVFPLNNLDEMIEEIIKKNPDAIICDFRLNEYKTEVNYTVPYNGVELVEKFLLIKEHFPCFIMTSFDNEVVPASEDVNIVYIKKIITASAKEEGEVKFLDKVKEQIRHYRSRISNAEAELKQLIELRNSGNATIDDESRLIELDTFLEKSLDGRTAIPTEYKSLSNQKQLSDLLEGVDTLIKKLEENT